MRDQVFCVALRGCDYRPSFLQASPVLHQSLLITGPASPGLAAMDRYQQFIEASAAQRPEIAAQLAELGELYHKKLWHQLTVKLEGYIELESFQRGGFLISLVRAGTGLYMKCRGCSTQDQAGPRWLRGPAGRHPQSLHAAVCCLQYQNFIAGFAHKINLLKLAVFASQVSKQIQDPQVRSVGFYRGLASCSASM